MTFSPRISIIVVNYNGSAVLEESLSALLEDRLSPPFELLIVDNASQDNSGQIGASFASQHPNCQVISSDSNRGYAGGVNLALPRARGEYVAVLNMDIRVTPGWLTPLVDFLDVQPQAGAVNPLILLEGEGNYINAMGQRVHITALGFNQCLGKPLAEVDKAPVEVSGLQGGAFVIRKQLLAEMGGLDEEGFLYHEDVDLSWLLLIKGYSLYCVPDSIVFHDYFLTMYPEKLFLLERNRLAMLFAYLQPRTWLLLLPWLSLTEAMLWGYCLVRGPSFLRAKAASYRWVISRQAHIAQRKRRVAAQRKRSDLQVLRKLSWGYAWGQFITLGKERGASRRQPHGGIPVELN